MPSTRAPDPVPLAEPFAREIPPATRGSCFSRLLFCCSACSSELSSAFPVDAGSLETVTIFGPGDFESCGDSPCETVAKLVVAFTSGEKEL